MYFFSDSGDSDPEDLSCGERVGQSHHTHHLHSYLHRETEQTLLAKVIF
jgi:hypothetical protein